MTFEWDPSKALANEHKHGIAFADATRAFDGPLLVTPSSRMGEERWLAVGRVHEVAIAVVFTVRGSRCRIISARRAHRREKARFIEALGRAEADG